MEETVKAPIPQTQEHIDEVVKVISPEQVSERIDERNDVAVAQIMGETTDMIQSAHQERTPGRTVEDIIDVNVSQEIEETGEVVQLTSQVRSASPNKPLMSLPHV